jgi:prevent-host-death family protein
MTWKMVNYQVMIRVNIADVKARLSRYLEAVEAGETIVLCRRNVPIAEIRPIRKAPEKQRPVGIDRGMTVPASFFEPLPDDLLDAFEGHGGQS